MGAGAVAPSSWRIAADIHHQRHFMNWDRIQGNWKQVTGKVQEQWGKLTDEDVDVVAGRRGQLVGKIQERYGVAKDVAEKELSDWQRRVSGAWFFQDEDRI
jgi:uncharacterized protein YjbJ (UPF0337 family)